ncbi:MAG: restriction endonuclease subunit S [Candidatus Aminicenantes bacterium]|nr:restriction endonuclease subunit S [Candidatus Aminicenantes bacterium]
MKEKCFRAYPEYRESGIEWLGKVPAHWQVKKLKYLIKKIESGNRENKTISDNEKIFSLGGEHIGWSGEIYRRLNKYISKRFYENLKSGKIKKDDILLVKDGATIGKCAIVKGIPFGMAAVNEHVYILRSNDEVISEFLFYLIHSYVGQIQILNQIRGSAQGGLNSQFVGNVIFTAMPINEQEKIAGFLDKKTGRIDYLIGKKERMIELLKEQRTAVIHRAVTRGLDPDAPMKDSGIGWLGKIPRHWQIKKAKWIFKEIDERSKTGSEELLSVSHYTGVTPRSEKNVYMFKAESYVDYKLCIKNDLVINIMWAWMGALGFSPQTGIVSSAYYVFRLKDKEKFNTSYLDYLVRTPVYVAEYTKRSKGIHSSRWRLYPDEFFQILFPIPPFDEQKLIVEYIKDKINKIDNAISKTGKQIELLKEYRQKLISDAVTGKIDLREE